MLKTITLAAFLEHAAVLPPCHTSLSVPCFNGGVGHPLLYVMPDEDMESDPLYLECQQGAACVVTNGTTARLTSWPCEQTLAMNGKTMFLDLSRDQDCAPGNAPDAVMSVIYQAIEAAAH